MSNLEYDRYKTLLDSAVQAAKAYYDTDVETMSDADYDVLVDEIETLEMNNGWGEAKDLLNLVAAGQSDGGDVEHSTPMLSLAKAGSLDAVLSFVNTVQSGNMCVEPKLDGLAISAVYEKGKLVRVATRGNGNTGEDITVRIGKVKGLPTVVTDEETFEVRGEVFITEEDFVKANLNRLTYEYGEWFNRNSSTIKVTVEKLYEMALANRADSENKKFLSGKTAFYPDKAIFANSRNAVAGSLRRENSNYVVPVTFACYDVLLNDPVERSYSDLIEHVESLGIKSATSLVPEEVNNEVNIVEQINKFGEYRVAGLSYPTDGIVLKADNLSERKRLGVGSKSPKWAIAYKYPSTAKQTVVENIELMIGRTGRLALRAKVRPVLVDGTLISYATLHNVSWVEEKDIRIGDVVLIRRANDVIPYIDGVVLSLRSPDSQKWVAPTVCPKCGTEWDKTTLLWRCPSPSCGMLNGIIFAGGRDYFDWEGLSEAIITRLNDEGLVNDIADVFALTQNQLANLTMGRKKKDGEESLLGEKVATKLYEQIQNSKTRPLSAVLAALGIRTLGRTFGRRFEKYFGSMSNILAATSQELTKVEGIAIKKADIIHAGLLEQSSLISRLAKTGVTMVSANKIVQTNSSFSGKKLVITGNIPGFTRSKAQELITNLGATASSSVSSSTDYLIADEESKTSSKYQKAVALGIKIISSAEFLKLVA